MTGRRLLAYDDACQVAALFPDGSPARRYLAWTEGANGAPEICNASAALALYAYELSRRGFRIPRPSDGGEYPITAWFAFVTDSGTGKSSAIRALYEFSQHAWHEASLQFEENPWIEPEGSIQGLTAALQARFERTAACTPALMRHQEFAAVLAGRDPITETLCKLYDGDTLELNYIKHQKRKARDANADKIVTPRVSALFATTESSLISTFTRAQRGGGLFSRIIWVAPTFTQAHIRLAQDFEGAEDSAALRELAVTSTCGWFAGLSLLAADGLDFVLTRAGHAYLESELFQPFREMYQSRAADDHMHGVRMRLVEKSRVFAAIHASWRGSLRMDVEDVAFGVAMCRVYYGHALKMAHLGAGDMYRLIQKTEEIILTHGEHGISRNELYKTLRTDKRTLDQVLETLQDANLVYADVRQATAGRLLHISTDAGQDAKTRAEAKSEASSFVPAWRQRPS